MGALVFAYCFAAFLVATPILASRLYDRRIAQADEQALVDLRRFAESRWTDWFLGTWSVLSVVGAIFLLSRSDSHGWGWLGVGVLYAVAILVRRQQGARLLAKLGDRGRIERTGRYLTRSANAYRFGAVGITGYAAMNVIQYAYPQDAPPTATALVAMFGIVTGVGAVGFVYVRLRMYLAGDDLTVKRST